LTARGVKLMDGKVMMYSIKHPFPGIVNFREGTDEAKGIRLWAFKRNRSTACAEVLGFFLRTCRSQFRSTPYEEDALDLGFREETCDDADGAIVGFN